MPVPTGLPPVTQASVALEATRFAAWFPRYRKHTPKATVIRLNDVQPDFVDWLDDDGLVLPRGSDGNDVDENGAGPSMPRRQGNPVHIEDSDASDDEQDDADEESSRDFSKLNAVIRRAIKDYDGGVFPKLDWSAPLDAAWIVPGGTLRCTTPADVYLLLKSSDFVAKDVAQLKELKQMSSRESDNTAPGNSHSAHLVLKKFFAIPTSHEFRCFVRAGRLVAISQRDTGTFFDHLQSARQHRKIRARLTDFYERVLWPMYDEARGEQAEAMTAPCRFPLADFVWDAYLTRDQERVFIIDINPYLDRTDALLWTWPELEEAAEAQVLGSRAEVASSHPNDDASLCGSDDDYDEEDLPLLRLVTSRAQTMQSFPTYAHNMVPSDVIGLSQGTDIASFARDFNAQLAEAAADVSTPQEASTAGTSSVQADSASGEANVPGR